MGISTIYCLSCYNYLHSMAILLRCCAVLHWFLVPSYLITFKHTKLHFVAVINAARATIICRAVTVVAAHMSRVPAVKTSTV